MLLLSFRVLWIQLLLFLLTGLCSLLSLQNTQKAAPESAEKRKQEKGSSAVFTGFVKHDDRFAQTLEVSYRSSD